MTNDRYAIIVAAGSGQRMKSRIPKQFLIMKGRPIIMHTLQAFHDFSEKIKLILVLPQAFINTWHDLVKQYQFKIPVVLQKGGNTRFKSVRNGLLKINGPGLVAIHDGVRPVVSSRLIGQSFEIAADQGSAVAAVSLKDSLREVGSGSSMALDRKKYKLVQTPQTFDVERIKNAYDLPESPSFTDDAAVWEAAGNEVILFDGSHENIKITTIHDLVLAEVLMKLK